jgi:hypothetical protein
MTVCHEGFQGLMDAAAEHASGWERFLGWLDSYLQPGRTSSCKTGEGLSCS